MEMQEPWEGKYEVGCSQKVLLFFNLHRFSRYLRRAKDRQLKVKIMKVVQDFQPRSRAVFESSANTRTKEG
jgi:hypothetical protein